MADFIESGDFKLDGDVIATPFQPTGGVTDHWPEFGDNRPTAEDEFREMEADGVDPDDMIHTGERALSHPETFSFGAVRFIPRAERRQRRGTQFRTVRKLSRRT